MSTSWLLRRMIDNDRWNLKHACDYSKANFGFLFAFNWCTTIHFAIQTSVTAAHVIKSSSTAHLRVLSPNCLHQQWNCSSASRIWLGLPFFACNSHSRCVAGATGASSVLSKQSERVRRRWAARMGKRWTEAQERRGSEDLHQGESMCPR